MTPAEPPDPRAERGSGDDPFSWLYHRGHPAPSEDAAPPVAPTVSSPAPVPQPSVPAGQPPPTPLASPPPSGPVPPSPPPSYAAPAYRTSVAPSPYAPVPEPPRRRRGVVVGVLVGVVALAAVAAGIVVAVLLNRPDTIVDYDPIAPQASSAGRTSAAPAARPVASGVTADCTAPPATDDAGRPVTYDAGNALDGNRNTAWRCDGTGDGHTLTFTFPAGTTISKVGLINGYAKTDPASGAKRYGEYRRITRVTWTLDNGATVTQNLRDGTQKIQQIPVPRVSTQRVTLTIQRSTKPGRKASSRDAVLISEVTFG